MTAAWLTSLALAGSPDCAALESILPKALECESATASDTPTSDAFGVRIEMLVSRDGSPFEARPVGTPVCSGDHLAFTITPSRRGYVSILSHGTTGGWEVLFPTQGRISAAFSPGTPVRQPRKSHTGYPLTGPPGPEFVAFIVSPTSFTSALSRELDTLLRRGSGATQPGPIDGGGERAFLLLGKSADSSSYVVTKEEKRIVLPIHHAASCPSG